MSKPGLTIYLLSDIEHKAQRSRAIPNEFLCIGSAPLVPYAAPQPKRNLGRVAHEKLGRVVDYLYSVGQRLAKTAEERDAFTLALALLGAVRRGEPEPLMAASYAAFGSSLPVYYARRAEAQWRQNAELVQASRPRRQEPSKRQVYALSPASITAQQKPVHAMPRKAKATHAAGAVPA
jgi:hypothetical protein